MDLESLRKIVQEVNAAPTLHEALSVVVGLVSEAMHSEVCSVYLYDERQQRYVLMASKGLNPESIGEVSLAMGEGLVGLVGQNQDIVNLADASSHPNFQFLPETGEERYNAFLGVPIMYRRQVLGVLVVQHAEREPYTDDEESLLITLSAQLSGAIAHAHASGKNDIFTKVGGQLSQKVFKGISGAGGIAIGRAVVYHPEDDLSLVPDRPAEDVDAEQQLFNDALQGVRLEVAELGQKMSGVLSDEELSLFDVYARMLDDHALPAEIRQRIEEGQWAQGAVRQTVERHVAQFAQMEDDYLKQRAADIGDLGGRILARLQEKDTSHREITESSILIAEDLPTSTLVELPLEHIAAIVTVTGSANSHMVIVARALGIPTIVGVDDLPLTQLDDVEMVVDAHQGRIFVHPMRKLRQRYKDIQKEEAQAAKDLDNYIHRETKTLDGTPIHLHINTGMMIDVVRGVQRGAEGVGLYRTEILFMLREHLPGEEEQRQVYRQQLAHFAGKPVVMRTLDIGADKSLPYFVIEEENSQLGWRGIRVSLDHPEIFSVQIAAMLRANVGLNNLHILLPMISSTQEIEDAKYIIHREIENIKAELGTEVVTPKLGMMLEVPATLFQLDQFAPLVDFFSVGSNDLTQYLLAVDRNNSKVAGLYSHYHPSILRAIAHIVKTCQQLNKPVSVCGEMAGDVGSAMLLIGLGLRTLSMSASNLLKVRKMICTIRIEQAEALVNDCLQLENSALVQKKVEHFMLAAGFDDLIKVRSV